MSALQLQSQPWLADYECGRVALEEDTLWPCLSEKALGSFAVIKGTAVFVTDATLLPSPIPHLTWSPSYIMNLLVGHTMRNQ